jgi:hypothetical protein
MATENSENSENNIEIFECKICDYICYKKQYLNQHFLSKKHKKQDFNTVENSDNNCSTKNYDCICGKNYKDRTGLWKHKKICLINNKENIQESFN